MCICRSVKAGVRVWVGPVQAYSTVHLNSILYQLIKYCTFIQYSMRPFSDVSENRHGPVTLSIGLCGTFQKDMLGHGVTLSFNDGQYKAF